MKKIFLILFYLLLILNIYAEQVVSTNKGISNALPGDYIIRSTGEMVILNQADIDYARKQVELDSNVIQQTQISKYNTNIQNKSSSENSSFIGIILVIVVIFIFIIKFSRKISKKTYRPFFEQKNIYRNKTYIDENGYRRFTNTNKAVHRWVAEKKLGRKLYPEEVVHHKNRNKLDNSEDNLEVFANQAEHDKVHKESGWYY
jgi:predicted PurR-regulated permease PerM